MSGFMAVVGFLLVCVAVVGWVAYKNRPIWLPLTVGFAVRLLCAFGAYTTVGFFAPDAAHYDQTGTRIADVWRGVSGATIPTISVGKDAFPYMLAGFDYLFGHIPMLGLIVNVTTGALLIPVVASTTKRLGGNPKTGAWITALSPPLLIWGDLLLREAITWLIMGVIVWALVRLTSNMADRFAWVILAVALIGLLGFRGTATLIVAGAALLALAFAQRRLWVTLTAAAITVLIAAAAISMFGVGHLDASRASLATARTGSFPTEGAGSMLLVVPKVFLGPFPWEWLHTGVPLALDAILWLAVLWFTWLRWKRSSNRRALGVVLLPAVALLLALVVSSGNYGTMQRLRVQSTVMLLPLAAVGLKRELSDHVTAGESDRVPSRQSAR